MSKQLALIVEDAPEIAMIFSDILSMSGLATEIIADGDSAIRRLNELTPDIILLDMHLPRVSGHEVLQFIRMTERLSKTKVVAVTADVLRIPDIENLVDLTLIKPVTFDQISLLSTRLLKKDLPNTNTSPN
jgi:two-component system response regulator AdeR